MEFDRRCKAFAMCLSCIMFANRLLGCFACGGEEERRRWSAGEEDAGVGG
jgi:hypothetical protein